MTEISSILNNECWYIFTNLSGSLHKPNGVILWYYHTSVALVIWTPVHADENSDSWRERPSYGKVHVHSILRALARIIFLWGRGRNPFTKMDNQLIYKRIWYKFQDISIIMKETIGKIGMVGKGNYRHVDLFPNFWALLARLFRAEQDFFKLPKLGVWEVCAIRRPFLWDKLPRNSIRSSNSIPLSGIIPVNMIISNVYVLQITGEISLQNLWCNIKQNFSAIHGFP